MLRARTASFIAFAVVAALTGSASAQVVISQVYGGGGNSGATYNRDFVELFNRGTSPVSLSGYSIQYAATIGTNWTARALPAVSIPAGRYFLIQMTTSGAFGASLPTPDFTVPASTDMSATAGKVALRSTATAFTAGTSCPVGDPTLIDFVGYGAGTNCFETAAAGGPGSGNNTIAIKRLNECTDTNHNFNDFATLAPTPRNSATPSPAPVWYKDSDSDTYGESGGVTINACTQPLGYSANNLDCNDNNASINPGAQEVCDAGNVDEDCDGQADDNDVGGALGKQTFYRDLDGDGYGSAANGTQLRCDPTPGFVASSTDCNDNNNTVYPGAPELCDGLDNNCAGGIDEGLTTFTHYRDFDLDTYGNPAVTTITCSSTPPAGYVANNTDCNDANANIHPGATELCNGIDDDCNGTLDDGLSSSTFYADADGDGYGNAAVTATACAAPPGYVGNDDDCNDASSAVHPGATEVCNGQDDDCDGTPDDGLTFVHYWPDADNDGYGAIGAATPLCYTPPPGTGWASVSGDCNDSQPLTYPGAPEICNGVDDSCNGAIDEGYVNTDGDLMADCVDPDDDNDTVPDASDNCPLTANLNQANFDNDTLGDACDPDDDNDGDPDTADCDDHDASIHHLATEICDGIDQDCDGAVDDGVTPVTSHWIGAAGLWSDASKWSTGHVPSSCTDVVIDTQGAVVTLDTIATVRSVTVGTQINGPPRIFILLPSSSLTVIGGADIGVLRSGILRVQGCAPPPGGPPCPPAQIVGDIDCDGEMEVMDDAGLTVTGSLFVKRGMNANVRSTTILSADMVITNTGINEVLPYATLHVGGNMTVQGGGALTLHEATELTVDGDFKNLIDSALNLEDDGLTLYARIITPDLDMEGEMDVAAGAQGEVQGNLHVQGPVGKCVCRPPFIGDGAGAGAGGSLTVTGSMTIEGAGTVLCEEDSSLMVTGDLTMNGAAPGSPPGSLAKLQLGGGSNVVIVGDTDGDLSSSVIERINDGSTAVAELEAILKNLGLLACRSGGKWTINLNPVPGVEHTTIGAVLMEGDEMTVECAEDDTIECDQLTANEGTIRWHGTDFQGTASVVFGDVDLDGGDMECSALAGGNIAALLNGNVVIGELSAMRGRATGSESATDTSSCTIETGPDSTLRGHGHVYQHRESDWDFVAVTVRGEISPGDAYGDIGMLHLQSTGEPTTFTLETGSEYRVDLGGSNEHDEIVVEGECAIVPRAVIKTYFETGDVPTQDQRVMNTSPPVVVMEGFAGVANESSNGCAPTLVYSSPPPGVAIDVHVRPGGSTFYRDLDGDGYGSALSGTAHLCEAGNGYVALGGDCNDNNILIHPGAAEICDGVDNNCTGGIDEGPDSDGDGVTDCFDGCPDDPLKTSPGVCGCGVPELECDPDSDGVHTDDDNCPSIANPDQADDDNDGVGNFCDNCPTTPNPGQEDGDNDGIGDACETTLTQLTIQLESVTAATLQRCLRLEFVDLPPLVPNSPLTVDVDVTFLNGTATFSVPGVECGDYDCVRIRDRKHTLATTASIVSTPTGCAIVLTGDDALLGGNLNDDPYVDILDFGLFVGRYGTNPGANSPCALSTVHADINGDGGVTINDYSYIQTHFLATSDAACGMVLRLAAPRTSITVPELFELGMGELVVADLTGDGVLDMADVAEYFDNGPPAGDVAIYTGESDGLWSDPANWSGEVVPGVESDVVITTRVVVDSPDAIARQVLVIPGAALTLLPGATGESRLRCEFLRVFDGGVIELACDGCGIDAADFILEGDRPLLWSAGTLNLQGGRMEVPDAPLTVGGTLQGAGAVTGAGVQSHGVIAPLTWMSIEANAALASEGSLRIGLHLSGCDALDVGGMLTLGGTLEVMLDDRVTLHPGDRWTIIKAAAIQGRFDRIVLPPLAGVVLRVQYEGDSFVIVCEASP